MRKSQTYNFKAKAMPDFSDKFNGVKPPSPKKLTAFATLNLSTHNRGESKEQKFAKLKESQEKDLKQQACFRATPNKTKKNVTIPDRVKSDKKTTRAVGMSLASNDRSVKREIFEQAMKEKEQKQASEKAQLELERIKQEEEEIKRIRAESNFKATPIMKYRSTLGEVAQKKLTVPVSPELQTRERANFKDESSAIDEDNEV